ncbi:cytochrome P450 [Streptomyces sp. SCA3-4]|uniref:cytochrome P450 n=1 Tax=Streptomyces sichuanensis TaxID=2871810 RepID=UPI001CE37BDE|nr:cytochrome P450 [Streptomyces sichuanensis]MCA6095486.1 cytochrome P450 [Streptomyces sichuanensis]
MEAPAARGPGRVRMVATLPSPQSGRGSHTLARNGVHMSQMTDPLLSSAVPDLSDPRRYAAEGIEEVWSRLRKAHPLFLTRRPAAADFWSVLSHDLASQVLRDSSAFSSTGGMRLDADPVANEAAAGKMLIVTDPPRHGGIRRVINSGFTPRMVRRLTDNIRLTAIGVIEAALEQGDVDFTEVAARLPVSVISDMLGVPRADWDFMLELTMIAFGADENAGTDPRRVAEAHTELLVYYDNLLRQRRRDPQDDIVSALAHGTVDGAPLTDEEILLNCNGLISGGNETTRHATVGGLLALMREPDQWARLRTEPDLLPSAVQEILRFTSPALHVLRTARQEVTLGGRTIRPGDQVAVWLPAANRDEAVFADPDRFDVARTPNRHLAFAQGTHFCLGSALATSELSIFFEEFVARVGAVVPREAPKRMESNLIWGFTSMPVTLTRRVTSH